MEEDARAASIKLRRLNEKYREFSKVAGLPEQRDRIKVYAPFETQSKREDQTSFNPTIKTIGKIDVEKYKVISNEIRTDEVIITDERIQHIQSHHPKDYERYSKYIKEMLENPQYILEDTVKNTAVILQEFLGDNQRFRLIIKLAVSGDNPSKKNSIITFLKISEKKFKKYLRNKKILYKSE